MQIVTGILIIVVVIGAMYYLGQRGFFSPLAQLISDVTAGFDEGYYGYSGSSAPKISAHYHEAVIRFVSLGEGQSELRQVIVVAHPKEFGYLDLTGWKLKTDKQSFRVPQTFNAYSPSTKDAAAEDIVMREGDRLYLISGKSPGGRDERVAAGEWHVFLGDFLPFPHGNISLLDASSSLVDQYSY